MRKGGSNSTSYPPSSTSSSSSPLRGMITSISVLPQQEQNSNDMSNPSRRWMLSSASTSSSSFEGMFNRAAAADSKSERPLRATTAPKTKEKGQLIMLRHGQSTWNQQNIFIGMTDTPLTPDGVLEARVAGNLMEEHADIDIVYTSLLRRATKTVWLVMQELGLEWVPIIKDWRLNERNYGALVGRNKKQAVEEFGKEQVKLWRRSYDVPPPPMDKESEHWPGKDPRYESLGINITENIPPSECLKDVCARTSVFFDECIVPQLRAGKKVLIVGHENNLRSIIMKIDNISREDIVHVELPRAIPLIYKLDPVTLKPEKFADAAPHLSAKYLADKAHLDKLMIRDHKQVYDLEIKENLEMTTPLTGLNLPNT